jgi:site-specific recombinase XerD
MFRVESNNHHNQRILTAGLSQLIKERLRKANIDSRKITAHSFRHTAAMNALKAGASLYEVQLFLGHTNPNTTQLYIKSLDEEKRLNNTPGKLLDNVY